MLLFWLCIKLLCEIALFALLGQGALHVLAGAQRERNAVYGLLQVATRLFAAWARKFTPARVAERHLPWVAGFLLAVLWLVATLEKLNHCLPALAVPGFERALALAPERDQAWYGLGLACIQLAPWDPAVNALERNTRLQPLSPYGWYPLARVRWQRGGTEAAHRIQKHLSGFEPKVAAQLERELGSGAPEHG
jgi:tetratricopeptide (TPR) repeat protein